MLESVCNRKLSQASVLLVSGSVSGALRFRNARGVTNPNQ